MDIAGLSGLPAIPADLPVLIAGPTASGKSALALAIAEREGGVIVNADASQVYDCWRVLTARPSSDEEARAPHLLYGHVSCAETYSTGQWLRAAAPLLSLGERPIFVGGTGLYFQALTRGMADIPPVPAAIRTQADALSLDELRAGIDARTAAGLDLDNRARVQRAWEVHQTTGRGLAEWQAKTPAPLLSTANCVPIVLDVDKDWLWSRIIRRFDVMLHTGALEEVAAMQDHYDPALPAFRAIGVPELMAYLAGTVTLDEARNRAAIATRQFAKRQRTWFRSKMSDWHKVTPQP